MGLIKVKIKNTLLRRISITSSVIAIVLVAQVCAPKVAKEQSSALTAEQRKQRERECGIALSNGWEYYKNGDFESSVRNFGQVVELGCGEKYAESTYIYLGRAFIEVGNIDSAVWSFKQGLRYLPENGDLLQNIAYSLGRQNNVTEQAYYLERLVEVNPEKTDTYKTLIDLYRDQSNYDEVIHTLQRWLTIEPNNASVQSDMIRTLEESGSDPLSFMRRRWEENLDNAQWGIDYARKLIESSDYPQAFLVLEDVIQRSPTNRKAYEILANAALDNGDITRGISVFERLFTLNRTDYATAIILSQTYLSDQNFAKSMEWAETAIRTSNSNGDALNNRAEIYFEIAEACVSSHDIGVANFSDKLVYQMAYEDYSAAISKGFRRARSRKDFLEKNLIPTKGDWFLQDATKRVFKPEGSCYSGITRTVTHP